MLRRVLIVGKFFPPSDESMALYMGDIADGLAAAGLEVCAVAEREPAPYTGPARLLAVPAPLRGRRNLWARGIEGVAFAAASAWHVWRHARADAAVLAVSMPPFSAFAVYPVARVRGATFVSLEYDIYPEIVHAVARIPRPLYAAWRVLRDALRRRADAIIVPSEGMARRVRETHGAAPVAVIPNWADGRIRPLPREEHPLAAELGVAPDDLVVLYSGTVGHAHIRPLTVLVDAAERMRDERIRWVVIGGGGGLPAFERLLRERGLVHHVTLLPRQPAERVPFTLTLADIAVVAVDDRAADLLAPSKLYGYQAAGVPVLVICDRESDLDAEVVEPGAGWRVGADEADRLVTLLRSV
ncbi:MAG: glycosyltransferase family 4 protein, partial [Dehalococcoidia bacterium]